MMDQSIKSETGRYCLYCGEELDSHDSLGLLFCWSCGIFFQVMLDQDDFCVGIFLVPTDKVIADDG